MLSRVAADLYWLARYVERAENTARLLDVASRLSSLPTTYAGSTNEWESAMTATGGNFLFDQRYDEANRRNVIDFLAFSRENPSSIASCLATARHSARSVRTAITREMWEVINDAWLELKRHSVDAMTPRQLAEFLAFVKDACLRLDGFAYRTMLRTDAHAFYNLGTFIERGDATARILDVKYHVLLPEGDTVGGGLDYFQWTSILRAASALTAYQWVFRDALRSWRVAELLTLRKELPRSIVNCSENTLWFLDKLANDYGRQGPAQRSARAYHASLANSSVEAIYREGLHEFLQRVIRENNAVGDAIEAQYLR
ncbi:alpha-E domain-containing protein [Acuticoccus sp. M5D2P5]|uniref:alpha-E domain-containing protein n=1 Tax=Acuticoccus kalidii TaxID=2910977 RepID=UPI001F32430C|nr:alpha-E domain-containing protein [Acuticoccus kalidii]MCF3936188.1 alpha-E domain-containing protein [Acuticoccus kalidii]